MLKLRAISFPLLLGLLAVIFFSPYTYGVWIFAVCAVLIIALAAYECARMMNMNLMPCSPIKAGLLTGALVAFMLAASIAAKSYHFRYYSLMSEVLWIMIIVSALLPWIATVFGDSDAARRGFVTAGVTLAAVVPFGLVTLLYFPEPKFLLFVILVTKAMDTGGYIFGMLSGKLMPGGNHKLCPSISPKKSWEGFAGGVLLALLTAWALRAIFPEWDFSARLGVYARWKEPVLALLLALASICGDLTESALKRKCGVKDSGNLIPGMGGPLDVLDSFIYVGPVCLFYSLLMK